MKYNRYAFPAAEKEQDIIDTIIPMNNNKLSAHNKLWRSVIKQALEDASMNAYSSIDMRLKTRTIYWLTAMDDEFCQVCRYAKLSPRKLKLRIDGFLIDKDNRETRYWA